MGRINRSELVGLTLKYFRMLGKNKNGKYAYVDQLNKVCEDIFGIKKLGDKLSHKKSQDKLIKAINTFDFESLVAMLADDSTRRKLSMMVQLRVTIDNPKSTSSEQKMAKKLYKKFLSKISNEYEVEKSYETNVISAAEALLNEEDDYGDWDYDDDDFESIWGTDDDSYGKSYKKFRNKKRCQPNRLAQLLYNDSGRGIDENYDNDPDGPIMTKVVDALVTLNDKLDKLVDGKSNDDEDDDDYDFDEYEPVRHKPSRQPRSRARPSTTRYRDPISQYSDDDEDWIPEYDEADIQVDQPANNTDYDKMTSQIIQAISGLSSDISMNNERLKQTESKLMTSINGISEDLKKTNAKVETLWEAMIEDDDDEESEPELPGITPPTPNQSQRNPSPNSNQQKSYPIRDSEVRNRSDPRK